MSNLTVRVADLVEYLKTLPDGVEFPVSATEDGKAFIRVAIELPAATVDPIVQPGPALATLGEATPAKEVIPSQDAQQVAVEAPVEAQVEAVVEAKAETAAQDVAVEAGVPDAGPSALGDVAAAPEGAVETAPVADASAGLGDGGFAPAAGVDKENA
jgi:hypothetical protein